MVTVKSVLMGNLVEIDTYNTLTEAVSVMSHFGGVWENVDWRWCDMYIDVETGRTLATGVQLDPVERAYRVCYGGVDGAVETYSMPAEYREARNHTF